MSCAIGLKWRSTLTDSKRLKGSAGKRLERSSCEISADEEVARVWSQDNYGLQEATLLRIERFGTKMSQGLLFNSWTAMDTQLRQPLECNGVEPNDPTWYEFFAGGGMARLGLGERWACAFSNEWCEKKAATYRARFGGSELRVCDVADLTPDNLPGTPTLVWGSFPCQDLSLAGNGAGLEGVRSGTFKPFWELMRGLVRLDRHPRLIVLENVVGTSDLS